MKVELPGSDSVIIGKRVTIGAAINSTAVAIAYFYPDKAPAIVAAAIPITLVVQILVARYFGVTQ